jgi:transcription initiation factor TFIID TATA-box-binding protein
VERAKDALLSALSFLDIISNKEPTVEEIIDKFEVKNIVFVASLEKGINLNALALGLGFEDIEYEPEQFPGLVYKPSSGSCTLLIFSSGKVVITGVTSEKIAKKQLQKLDEKIEELLE